MKKQKIKSASNSSESLEISDEAEPGEYSYSGWRVIMSDEAGRPFYYNTKTQIGQFATPDEFSAEALEALEALEGESKEEDEEREEKEGKEENQLLTSSYKKIKSHHDSNAISSPIIVNTEVLDLSLYDSPQKIETKTEERNGKRNEKFIESQIGAGDDSISELKSSSQIVFKDVDSSDSVSDSLVEFSEGSEGSEVKFLGILGSQGSLVQDLEKTCNGEEDKRSAEGEDTALDRTQIDCDRTQMQSQSSNDIYDLDSTEERSDPRAAIGDNMNNSHHNRETDDDSKWNCTMCTYQNSADDSACYVCKLGMKRRRSQRDGQTAVNTGSGTIMHGFALTQQSQPQSYSDVGAAGPSNGATARLPASALSNRRLSLSTSIINLGVNSNGRSNNRTRQR